MCQDAAGPQKHGAERSHAQASPSLVDEKHPERRLWRLKLGPWWPEGGRDLGGGGGRWKYLHLIDDDGRSTPNRY